MNEFEAKGLVDLHNHLVPGVDDGAQDMDESIRSLRVLANDGLAALAVSPHLDGCLAHGPGDALETRLTELLSSFHELRRNAMEAGLPVPIFSQEILIPDAATAWKVFRGREVGLSGTEFALVEFGFELGEDPVGVVHTMLEAGRRPIVAHPERYRRGNGAVGFEEINAWKEAGALLQVNAGSFLGQYGDSPRHLAWRIVTAGLADIVSSDHHGDYRPVSLSEAGRALAAEDAAEQARLLLSENPRRILAGRSTVRVPPRLSETTA